MSGATDARLIRYARLIRCFSACVSSYRPYCLTILPQVLEEFVSPFCPSGAVSGEIGCGGGRVAARVIPGCSQFHCFDIVSYLFPFHPAFAHVRNLSICRSNLSICLSICLHACLSACPSVALLTTFLWSDVVLPENRARKCCDVRVSPFLLVALVHTRTHANTQTDIPTRTQSNIQSIFVRIHHACTHTHTHKHIRTSEVTFCGTRLLL